LTVNTGNAREYHH